MKGLGYKWGTNIKRAKTPFYTSCPHLDCGAWLDAGVVFLQENTTFLGGARGDSGMIVSIAMTCNDPLRACSPRNSLTNLLTC